MSKSNLFLKITFVISVLFFPFYLGICSWFLENAIGGDFGVVIVITVAFPSYAFFLAFLHYETYYSKHKNRVNNY
jgi:hypothetical protein